MTVLGNPIGIVFDTGGALLFIDPKQSVGKVRAVTPGADGLVNGGADERVVTVAGQVRPRAEMDEGRADGGPASAAVFNAARSLALDHQGNLYVADILDHSVRRVNAGADGLLVGRPEDGSRP